MKKSILFCILCVFTASTSMAQDDIKAIKKVIATFSKAGDQNDVVLLDKYLDQNYRVVMNRLFGSDEVSVLSKTTYLEKIKTKEFGDDQRKLTFDQIIVNGTTATAKVVFRGTKMTFTSLLTLLRDNAGEWKLVSDIPIIS